MLYMKKMCFFRNFLSEYCFVQTVESSGVKTTLLTGQMSALCLPTTLLELVLSPQDIIQIIGLITFLSLSGFQYLCNFFYEFNDVYEIELPKNFTST